LLCRSTSISCSSWRLLLGNHWLKLLLWLLLLLLLLLLLGSLIAALGVLLAFFVLPHTATGILHPAELPWLFFALCRNGCSAACRVNTD
jgi:hypothetical protein